jgi:hypothetical protein
MGYRAEGRPLRPGDYVAEGLRGPDVADPEPKQEREQRQRERAGNLGLTAT